MYIKIFIFDDSDDYFIIVNPKRQTIEIPNIQLKTEQLPKFLEALKTAEKRLTN